MNMLRLKNLLKFTRLASLALLVAMLAFVRQTPAQDQPGAADSLDNTLVAGPAQTKSDKFAVPNLDELIPKAMENHPDIVVAKTKVTLAEAELKNKQLEVSREMVDLREKWMQKHSAFEKMKREFKGCQTGFNTATTPEDQQRLKSELDICAQGMALRKAELTEINKEIQTATTGDSAIPKTASITKPTVLQQIPRGPVVEKLKHQLNEITVLAVAADPH